MADAATIFDKLLAHTRETALLESINGLLNWDERTKMPPAAGEYRAEQITCEILPLSLAGQGQRDRR